MFTKNVEFRVTIRDFHERTEPQILKEAGSMFVRAIREASSEYLENSLDPDAELRWNVTLHEELGVGTMHYVLYREELGLSGKCLVWDLAKGPTPNKLWIPITMRPGQLHVARLPGEAREAELAKLKTAPDQPAFQDFSAYLFQGWMPAERVTPVMFEEDALRTLVGLGFSAEFCEDQYPRLGVARALEQLKTVHQIQVTQRVGEKDPAHYQAARLYEVDLRPAKQTVSLKITYLMINTQDDGREDILEAVVQEGGWLSGIFAQCDECLQPVDAYTWLAKHGVR